MAMPSTQRRRSSAPRPSSSLPCMSRSSGAGRGRSSTSVRLASRALSVALLLTCTRLSFPDILVPFVTRLTQQDNPPPPPTDFGPSRAASTARELRSRLFWTTYVLAASLEAQSGRSLSASGPKGFSAQDCRLALPISDDRFEMGACGEGLRSDGLTHPEAGPSKMLISELGHVRRPFSPLLLPRRRCLAIDRVCR